MTAEADRADSGAGVSPALEPVRRALLDALAFAGTDGTVQLRVGPAGADRGILYVPPSRGAQLRAGCSVAALEAALSAALRLECGETIETIVVLSAQSTPARGTERAWSVVVARPTAQGWEHAEGVLLQTCGRRVSALRLGRTLGDARRRPTRATAPAWRSASLPAPDGSALAAALAVRGSDPAMFSDAPSDENARSASSREVFA